MNLTYYSILISIILALFYRNRTLSCACIAIAGILAWHEHIITIIAAISLGLLALTLAWYYHYATNNNKAKPFILVLITVLLAGFVLHEIPGLTNSMAVYKLKISQSSRPYTMLLNFDKVMAGLILYTLSPIITLEHSIDKLAFKQTVLIFMACIIFILGPAILSGYIRLDPKVPHILPIWIINNLVFVCFSEEVIFRGFVQRTLQKYLGSGFKYGLLSIILASIVFGLAHYKDGITFMMLAAICGLFYGYTYLKTKRILCAMLVNFLLNLTHILIFTYPS